MFVEKCCGQDRNVYYESRGRVTSRVLEIDPVTVALVWSYTDGRFSASNIGGARLPDGNTFIAGRTVINDTAVPQRFDFEIRFSNPQLSVDNDNPPLFTVLQEQFGLKLISDTGPLEVLVIDRIETPTEN